MNAHDNSIGAKSKLQQIQKLKQKAEKRKKVAPPVPVNLEEYSQEQLDAFERTHVHKVYDNIASHFSGTRYQAWPQVDAFLEELPSLSTLADIGCGNGKYLSMLIRLILT